MGTAERYLEKDKLEEIFALQRELQRKINTPDFEAILGKTRTTLMHDDLKAIVVKWHKEFSLALMMEASELMDWVAWKHWSKQLGNKSQLVPFEPEHVSEVKREIADVLHFLVNLAILWGMTPDDLFAEFKRKNAVNHQRQDGGSY